MKAFRVALAAVAGFGLSTAMAVAADPLLPVYSGPSGAVWDGFYFGAGVSDAIDSGTLGLGVSFGLNQQSDQFVYGFVLDAALLSSGDLNFQGSGRVGFLPTDQFLLYGLAGVGTHTTFGGYGALGAGVELALNDTLSVRLEGQHAVDFSSGIGFSVLIAGLNYHF